VRVLQSARQDGEIDGWLQFFLRGIEAQANDALARAERLVDLREHYRALVVTSTRSRAAELVELALESPIMTARFVERRLEVTRPTALSLLRQLDALGILERDRPGPRGQKVYVAREIMAVVAADDQMQPPR
jgi:Fic family protein